MKAPLRAYLVDDEPLALKRLTRMIEADGRVSVAGSATDPAQALADLARHLPDVLFLDIEMPGMSGFDLLARLPEQPLVIFTRPTTSTRSRPSRSIRSTTSSSPSSLRSSTARSANWNGCRADGRRSPTLPGCSTS